MPKKDAHERVAEVYEKLLKVRESKAVKLTLNPFLKPTFVDIDGVEKPLNLRYYQVQGIYHLLVMPKMVLGDATGLGKTISAISSFCYVWEKHPQTKVIVVTPKSALRQWASEIPKFTTGIIPTVVDGSLEARKRVYAKFFAESEKRVLLLNYHILCRDWRQGAFDPRPGDKTPRTPGLLDEYTAKIGSNLLVVFDEATAFKSMKTKTWDVCSALAYRSVRAYGLTATLLKNNLMEGFAIYKALVPDLFSTKKQFFEDYCITKKMPTSKGFSIDIVVGYKNLDQFRARIDPFFLGRHKHAVSDELPVLTTRDISVTLNAAENIKYAEALSGLLELGDGEVKDYEEHKAFVSLIYCQQVVNSLALLKFDDEISSKEEALVDLLGGELESTKTIVYTRFASHVPRLKSLVEKAGIKSVCITGKENDTQRQANQKTFQDAKSEVQVIFITDAGSEAINLQMAGALVFFDAPWSYGNYIQIIGRMVRIGSPHRGVLVYHIIADWEGDDQSKETIDWHVLQMLRKKKSIIERVLGEGAVGALEFDSSPSSAKALLQAMRKKRV